MRTHALAPFENERENVASNAWPAEEIAKHQNSPSSKGCLSKAGVGGFSSVSSTRGGQTMNPVTLVTPAVRLLASKLSQDQQRAIGRERYRVPARRRERSLSFGGCDEHDYVAREGAESRTARHHHATDR